MYLWDYSCLYSAESENATQLTQKLLSLQNANKPKKAANAYKLPMITK